MSPQCSRFSCRLRFAGDGSFNWKQPQRERTGFDLFASSLFSFGVFWKPFETLEEELAMSLAVAGRPNQAID